MGAFIKDVCAKGGGGSGGSRTGCGQEGADRRILDILYGFVWIKNIDIIYKRNRILTREIVAKSR